MTEPTPDETAPDDPRAANAITHGLRSGKLPRGCSYIRRQLTMVQREIEAAVQAAQGEITFLAAATIQSAVRWERHALLAGRWLANESAVMDHATRLAFSREVARASSERDKCLRELAIDRPSGVLDAGQILRDLAAPKL